MNLKTSILVAGWAGSINGPSRFVDILSPLAALRTVGPWAKAARAQIPFVQRCFCHLSAGNLRAKGGAMPWPGLAKCGAPIRRRRVWFVCSTEGFCVPVFLLLWVILMTWYLILPWVPCGPVSNCDTDPLVQLVEVLEIGGNGEVLS